MYIKSPKSRVPNLIEKGNPLEIGYIFFKIQLLAGLNNWLFGKSSVHCCKVKFSKIT